MSNWNPFMNNLRVLLLVCAAACSLLTAHAESLFHFPETGAWTVDIVPWPQGKPPPAAAATPPPVPGFQARRIDITKVNGVSRNVITWADGKTTERWGYDKYGIIVSTETYNKEPTFLSGEDIQLGSQYSVGFDAASLSWIKESLLKDTVLYQGKKCFHYVGTVTVEQTKYGGGDNKYRVDIPFTSEAWIDKDSLIPVAAYDGMKLGVFTFHDAPNSPLNPPEKVKRAMDHLIAAGQPLQ